MEGLVEREQLVVEVMTQLMDQGSQEGLERDDVFLLRGAHPHADARERAFVLGFVEPVQLAGTVRRPGRQHAYAHFRHVISAIQRVDQRLARGLHSGAPVLAQARGDRFDDGAEHESRRQTERDDLVAAPVGALARGRELVVVGEAHGDRTSRQVYRTRAR